MSEALKQKTQEKIGAFAGSAVAAYVVAKTVHDARAQQRAEREAKREAEAAAEREQTVAEPAPAPKAQEPSQREKAALNREKGKLSALKTYIGQHINAPASIRKILPRDGVYHSPWAYHHSPSYASLNMDQSEYSHPKLDKYNSGMEQLVAAGKKPLGNALSASRKQHPDSPWGTILSGKDLSPSNGRISNAAAARNEKERIIGLWSAVEGMGFDSGDMAFAHWEDKDGSYSVVPYDVRNDLHHTAAGGLADGTELAKEPGFMIRFQGTRPQELSVSIRSVDIDSLRSEMGNEVIPPTPDPRELARQEYHGPGVLPSTQVGGF